MSAVQNAAGAVPGGGDDTGQPQRQQRGWLSRIGSTLLQVMLIHSVMGFFFGNKNRAVKDPSTGTVVGPMNNILPPRANLDVWVHLLPSNDTSELNDWSILEKKGKLLWKIDDVEYFAPLLKLERKRPDDVEIEFSRNISLQLTEDIINGSTPLHIVVTAASSVLSAGGDEATLAALAPHEVIRGSASLLEMMEPFTEEELQSLVSGGQDSGPMGGESRASAARNASEGSLGGVRKKKLPQLHLKSRLDLYGVYDSSKYSPQQLTVGPLVQIKQFPEEGLYHPYFGPSDFWLLERDFMILNDTVKDTTVNITLRWYTLPMWKWSLEAQMVSTWKTQSSYGMSTRRDTFMLKRIITDTNPYMLAFSALFILLHTLFSMLAFKNDIHFWHSNDSMQGLSALSIATSFICELVIALYLLDSQETSWLILAEIFMGIVLEGWKFTKAIKVEIRSSFPFIKFSDKKNYAESKTKQYDEQAIKYMSILLTPCMIGYGIWALYHNKYRSWYSYVVSVLAGSVYTFGFIMMCPQLYINYKLKSVEHLPWKALIFRALNTFVDDIAAFIIDMPWMHRLACFRNDIIFLIYVYQRWIYKTDKTRTTPGWVSDHQIAEATAAARAQSPSAAIDGATTYPSEPLQEVGADKKTDEVSAPSVANAAAAAELKCDKAATAASGSTEAAETEQDGLRKRK